MAIAVGCKVRFLNDVGGGEVIRMIDKRTALVLTTDGFEVPTLISELVVVEPAAEQLLNNNADGLPGKQSLNGSVKKDSKPKKDDDVDFNSNALDVEGDEISLTLALVPENIKSLQQSDFSLYLINDSSYRVFYVLSNSDKENHSPISFGILTPDSKIQIKKFLASDINKLISLNLQALYFKNTDYKPYQPEFYDIEIDPIKLYKRGNFRPNDFFDQEAYLISVASTKREAMIRQLTEKAIIEAVRQKEVPAKPAMAPQKSFPEAEEVDLHIHELVDNWKDLSAGEILKIQLARFETALEGAIKSGKVKRMVFIHGVGNGKLKYEITRLLNSKYPKLRYQDASFKEYGFGATLVFIR